MIKINDVWMVSSQEEKFKLVIYKTVAAERFFEFMSLLRKHGMTKKVNDLEVINIEKIGECITVIHDDFLFGECMAKKFPFLDDEITNFFNEMETEVQRRIDTMVGQETMFIGG